MSRDSDIADMGRAMKADRQGRHARWNHENRTVLTFAGIPFTDRGEALLFRIAGKPRVDFYPSSGRWRVAGEQKTHRGQARAFLAWFAKQGNKP